MGTNYYLYPKGSYDKKYIPPLHIGKSSAGWCFSLHVYPDRGIYTLDDWKNIFNENTTEIRDEYGEIIAVTDMLRIITERDGELKRHTVDGRFCIGHGEGTWDYMIGEFS